MSHNELAHRSHITLLVSIGSDSVAQILSFYKHPRRITNRWQTRKEKKNVVLNCFSKNNVLCLKFLFCFFNFEQFVMGGYDFF